MHPALAHSSAGALPDLRAFLPQGRLVAIRVGASGIPGMVLES